MMCNSVIISRLKALQRYEIERNALWEAPDGPFLQWDDIQEIIDEFEVKDGH